MVTRFTQETDKHRIGDWLVIENKATFVGVEAADQLARYVDWLADRGLEGAVHGLLIADGRTVALGRALSERGFGYTSLAVLGYRDVVRRRPAAARTLDRDVTTDRYPSTLRLPPDHT